MGTSSARRGPTGPLWRLAKRAAGRYLAPQAGAGVAAGEVAARYVAALAEDGASGLAGALAAFRLTRKVAQNLGAWASQAAVAGWPAALDAWGLKSAAGEEVPAQALSAALEVPGGGLEQAAAHAALVGILLELPAQRRGGEASRSVPEAEQLVRRFLTEAFLVRLALDLGESMEAAAPGASPLKHGLAGISRWLEKAAAAESPAAPTLRSPQDWLGLPGWIRVTRMLEALLLHLRDQGLPPKISGKF